MKKFIQHSIFIFSFALFCTPTFSQISIEASIENVVKDATKVSFDIYLKTQVGSTGDLYLDGSDFVIDFDGSNFSSPAIVQVGDIYGGNEFGPMSTTPADTSATRNSYYNTTSLSIVGSQIVINLNSQTPANSAAFTSSIARIDNSPSVHKLGSFEITGIVDPSMPSGLAWDYDNLGLRTVISTLENVSPFNSNVVPTNNILFTVKDDVLPVELAAFSSDCENDNAKLTWTTLTEINSAYTLIQRSSDQSGWTTIKKIEAGNDSNAEKTYTFVDQTNERLAPVYYYRLVFVDRDETTEYSDIVTSSCGKVKEEGKMKTFPNPVHTGGQIRFEFSQNDQAKQVMLTDMSGRMVFIQQMDFDGQNEVNLPSDLPAGFYIANVESKDGYNYNERIVIQ